MPDELQVVKLDPTSVADPSTVLRGAEGRQRLRQMLDAQHYRLTFWRRGPAEINYRRFFDVNDLAALRQEDPEVFAATHELVLDLVAEGSLDGLRIDHVDGLLDPLGYLERLRAEVERRADGATFPIVVEKILSPGEKLRRGWPVQGTTGYEFLNELEEVFLDPDGYAALERGYRSLRRLTSETFSDIVHAVTAAAGVDNEAVRDVRVLERFSLLSVPADDAQRIVAAVDGAQVRGVALRVERAGA